MNPAWDKLQKNLNDTKDSITKDSFYESAESTKDKIPGCCIFYCNTLSFWKTIMYNQVKLEGGAVYEGWIY